MDCACTVSNDYESEDCHWGCREIKRAAKNHTCYECGVSIPVGTAYFYHTVFGDGTASNYKYCSDCQSVTKHFFNNGWFFGSVWDSLFDYLSENWRDDLPSSCICKLPPTARDKVCDILDDIHSR